MLDALSWILLRGKGFVIFSFMFGLSFALQMQRAERQRPGMDFRPRFVWRLLILFAIGWLHGLVYSGDTTTNDALWRVVNAIGNLRYIIIETAFCNRERGVAIASKHLCPSMLADELAKLTRPAEIYITHLKPGEPDLIMHEIAECARAHAPRMLRNGQVFEL